MGDVAFQRQATMEFLGELPDIDFLTVPVDDYFGSYVAELGARGQQESQNVSQSPVMPAFVGLQANGAHLQQTPLDFGANVLPNGLSDFSSEQTTPFGDLDPTRMPPIVTLPSFPQTSATRDQDQQGAIPGSDSGSAGMEEDDHTYAASNGRKANGISKAAAAAGAAQKRNAKQQVQNKQAQQRYRERRKQRFTEMEHTIDELTQQLEALKGVHGQNEELKVRASALEQMVTNKQVETEQLQQRLTQLSTVEDVLRSRDDTGTKRGLTPAEIAQFTNSYADEVGQLRVYLDTHKLREADALGRGVDPAVVAALGELVHQGFVRCARALRADGVQALDLMSRDVKQINKCSCPVARERWTRILDELRLTEQQQQQLLTIRTNHLAELRKVLVDRQSLNMQAISEMLPRSGESDLSEPAAVDGKMACIGNTNSYLPCAKRSVQLNSVLDAVKDNLHREQKRVMEMKFVVVHRVLSPIQAALLITMSHPEQVDVLALVNVLSSRLGRSDSDSGNSSSHTGASDFMQSAGSARSESPPLLFDSKKPCATESCPLLANGGTAHGA